MQSTVPDIRIRVANPAPPDPAGDRVVYWMIAARRVGFNFALQRAADWARELGRPLVVLEALRCDYPWASDRLHRFVLDGMRDNQRRLAGSAVAYHPYVERERGAGRGLLAALAERAAAVVTDDYPTFFLPRMMATAAAGLKVRLEAVDSNGLLPLAASDRAHATAASFRRFLQRSLVEHLAHCPLADPLATALPPARPLPSEIARHWPAADLERLATELGSLPIDHGVAPAPTSGGSDAAERALGSFLDGKLERYAELRNRPEDDATSGLAPYLHFGHISAHQVFLDLATSQRWTPADLASRADGRRAGWWGLGESAEAFLDQLLTWRELGFGFCRHRPDHDRWESLPEWARTTLSAHAGDPRQHLYSLDQLAAAATHDPLWNAAQRQLVREGRLHNYLRMLWGKKILEWTREPREALEDMVELNNRYALDGRDPNSYSGIFWVLGRHDRPWGPERPIFGTVRFMSSTATARKLPLRSYVARYS